MMASIVRISLLLGISAAAWFFYPQYKPLISPFLDNPRVLGSQALEPVISKVNDILPDNIQIPTSNKDNPKSTDSSNSTNLSNITNSIVDQVKQKAEDAAQEQINAVKKETGNAFCAALIETIKKQCGLPN